jgi:ketosteroid isomerase-like protein
VRIEVDGVSVDRIRDGRIVEGADYWDALGLRRQLGVYSGE